MPKQKILLSAVIVVGVLYVFHMWNTHGTGKQFLSGIGINR